MIGKRLRSLPFIFANDNYTLSRLPVPAGGSIPKNTYRVPL